MAISEQEKLLLVDFFQKKFNVLDEFFENLRACLGRVKSTDDPNDILSEIYLLVWDCKIDLFDVNNWYNQELKKIKGG
jgi:hypothetical protein